MKPTLKAELWVKALIRRCAAQNVPAVLVRRGEGSAGSVLIKVSRLDDTATVYSPARAGDGSRIWLRATGPEPVSEPDAEAYIARQESRDPDIWVVEIEDREGRHFLQEPVD